MKIIVMEKIVEENYDFHIGYYYKPNYFYSTDDYCISTIQNHLKRLKDYKNSKPTPFIIYNTTGYEEALIILGTENFTILKEGQYFKIDEKEYLITKVVGDKFGDVIYYVDKIGKVIKSDEKYQEELKQYYKWLDNEIEYYEKELEKYTTKKQPWWKFWNKL